MNALMCDCHFSFEQVAAISLPSICFKVFSFFCFKSASATPAVFNPCWDTVHSNGEFAMLKIMFLVFMLGLASNILVSSLFC